MSVEFANAYQEILLDNLVSIIKQNFIFQTQLKLTESTGKELQETRLLLEELREKYNAIKDIAEQAASLKQIADQTSSLHDEKSRIQEALNNSLMKTKELTEQIVKQNEEIKKLNDYVSVLEKNVSVTKLKKLDSSKAVEMQKSDSKIVSIKKPMEDGSAF